MLLIYNEIRQILSQSVHVLLSKTANPITFMWDDDSKPIQKFYITGVPHVVNSSYWRTFHILTLPPSSVNEQVITITACILSPSSAHDHDLYAAMALKPQWCVLTHTFFSHILLPLQVWKTSYKGNHSHGSLSKYGIKCQLLLKQSKWA